MAIDITWEALQQGSRLDEDKVKLRLADNEVDDEVEFSLQLVGAVNWWKGLEIKNSGDQQVGFVQASGSRGSGGPMDYEYDAVEGGTIVLWKAKFAGIHTPMYAVRVDDRILGKKLVFRWTADS